MAKTKTETEPREIPTQQAGDGSSAENPLSKAEIEKAQAQSGTVVSQNAQAVETLVQWCVDKADTTDEDQFELQAQIIRDIISGESAEEVLKERAPLHARDILNTPLLLHSIEIREGSFEDSQFGYYAALTVSAPNGSETRVVTCGAIKILAKCFALDRIGEFPQLFWFTERQTRKGFGVLDMVRPTV